MPKKLPETTFKVKLGKLNKPEGNLLIYVPKMEADIYGLKPGDSCEVTLKVLKRAEDRE